MIRKVKQVKLVSNELTKVVRTNDEGLTLETISPYAGYLTHINSVVVYHLFVNLKYQLLNHPVNLYEVSYLISVGSVQAILKPFLKVKALSVGSGCISFTWELINSGLRNAKSYKAALTRHRVSKRK